jgi:uncharacterized alpha-E superfamily protein
MLSSDADSLYWMSRYLERAEHTARMIDVNLVLMLDQSPLFAARRWGRLLDSLHVSLPDGHSGEPRDITEFLTLDRNNPASIMACLTSARDNARQVREQISSEMWEQINRLYLRISRTRIEEIWNEQPHEFLQMIKEGIHLFQGITNVTMPRNEGWQWMEVGRSIERASKTAALLAAHHEDFAPQEHGTGVTDYLDWVGLLKSRTAFEAYCQVYTADLRPDRIAEFLLLNAEFPHSVLYAVRRLQGALQAIGKETGARKAGTVERLAGRLRSMLDYAQIDEIMFGDLQAFLADVQQQCLRIHTGIYQIYVTPPLESILDA